MQYLIAFHSTQQAIRLETLLDYYEIYNEVQPTPKAITAGCALSIAVEETQWDAAQQIIRSEQVAVYGVFLWDTATAQYQWVWGGCREQDGE